MKKVLVVDDSHVPFELLRRALSGGGKYSVEFFCKNGENLLALYEEHRPDLVVMDIVMEGVNGIDLTGTLLRVHPEARVVILSSMAYREVIDSAMAAGAAGYIHKPFHADQVLSEFDKVLA